MEKVYRTRWTPCSLKNGCKDASISSGQTCGPHFACNSFSTGTDHCTNQIKCRHFKGDSTRILTLPSMKTLRTNFAEGTAKMSHDKLCPKRTF